MRFGVVTEAGTDAGVCEAVTAEHVVVGAGDMLGSTTCTGVHTVDFTCWPTTGTQEAHYLFEARDASVILEIDSEGGASFATVDPDDCTRVLECGLPRLMIEAGEILHVVVEYDPPSGRCGAFSIAVGPAL